MYSSFVSRDYSSRSHLFLSHCRSTARFLCAINLFFNSDKLNKIGRIDSMNLPGVFQLSSVLIEVKHGECVCVLICGTQEVSRMVQLEVPRCFPQRLVNADESELPVVLVIYAVGGDGIMSSIANEHEVSSTLNGHSAASVVTRVAFRNG